MVHRTLPHGGVRSGWLSVRRALGRAGIVEGYEDRCRKPTCGHV